MVTYINDDDDEDHIALTKLLDHSSDYNISILTETFPLLNCFCFCYK